MAMQRLLSILFLLLLLGCALPLYAQSSTHRQVRARFDRFARFTKALQADSILAYTYPKLFQLVPREAVKANLAKAGEEEDLRIEMGALRLDSISRSVFTHDGEAFALIYYRAPMTVTLLGETYRNKEIYDKIGRQFAAEFGIENLTGDRDRYQYVIDAPKRLFAIRRRPGGNWYFLEYHPDNLVLLDALLDQAVRQHFDLE
jgi:hypothetical protein